MADRLDNHFPMGQNDPRFSNGAEAEFNRRLKGSESELRENAIRAVLTNIQQDEVVRTKETALYLGQEVARSRWQSYQSEEWRMSLLYFAIGGFVFWADPLKAGMGLAAGCLVSAWEPLMDVTAYKGGSIVHRILKYTTGGADEGVQDGDAQELQLSWPRIFRTLLVTAYPAAYLLGNLPLVGSYFWFFAAPVTTTYVFACSALMGNRFFRHINQVHEEYHPQGADNGSPLLFRLEEMRELWQNRIVPAWNNAISRIPPQVSWVVDPWHSLDQWLLAREVNRPNQIYTSIRGWFSTKATMVSEGAYTTHMLAVGLFGAWMCMSDSPYLFTGTAVITAYFAATTKSADLSLNPITRWLSPLVSSPVLLLGLGVLYIGAKIVTFGFATGLAVSTYWRGPYSFPVYQVLGFAFTSTWTEDLVAVAAGIAAGGQLWHQSRRLYQERNKDLSNDFFEIIFARLADGARWSTNFFGEGIMLPLANQAIRLFNRWQQPAVAPEAHP
jgi:hypothetical protein